MSTLLRCGLLGVLTTLVIAVSEPATARDSSYAVAARHYQLEEWEAAAAGFAAVLADEEATEDHLASRFLLAECRMQLGQYALARGDYHDLLRIPNAEFAERSVFRAGEAALLAGDETAGADLLKQFLRDYPRHPMAAAAMKYLAQQSLKRGDAEAAIVLYEMVLDYYPNSEQANAARLGLAKALLAGGKAELVPRTVGPADDYETDQLAGEAMLLTGRAYYELGQHESALQSFKQSYEAYPDTPTARRARIAAAWALWRAERFAEIEAVVAPLSSEAEWLADYHYLTGMAAYGQSDWKNGARHLSKASAVRSDHPSHDAMLFYQGVCYARQKRVAVAKHLFQRLQAEHPHSRWLDAAAKELVCLQPEVSTEANDQTQAGPPPQSSIQGEGLFSYYDTGSTQQTTNLQQQRDLEKAKQLLDEAVAFERDGRYGSAVAAFRELIELESITPERVEGLRRSAELHRRMKRHTEAMRLYRLLLAEQAGSPRAAESIAAIGWMQVSDGEKRAARETFEDLLEKFPQSPQVAATAYWLGHVAADENDSETAGRYARLALDSLNNIEEGSAHQPKLLAQVLALQCQLAAAAEDWQLIETMAEQALPSFPAGTDRARLAYWQAEAVFRSKSYNEAREKFGDLDNRTFGIRENWVAMVPLRRAQLAARRQQWKEVLKFVERIDREHPDFRLKYEVDYLRGRAEAGRGNFSAARRAYQEVIANNTAAGTETAAAAQWMIGETYFHQQNYEVARSAYLEVIGESFPAAWQARAAMQAGKCWELQERWQEAQAMYREALQRWPNAELQDEIRARLNWAEGRSKLRR